jgi:hypothetical protein
MLDHKFRRELQPHHFDDHHGDPILEIAHKDSSDTICVRVRLRRCGKASLSHGCLLDPSGVSFRYEEHWMDSFGHGVAHAGEIFSKNCFD